MRMNLIGGFRGEDENGNIVQCGIYFDGLGRLAIKKAVIDMVTEEPEMTHETTFKVHRTPINLTEDERIDALKEWLEEVLTRSYPSPLQIRYLQRMSDSPNDILTQAVLDCCVRSDNCLCALVWSCLGCPEFIRAPIQPTNKYMRSWMPKQLDKTKCIDRAFSYLRQFTTVEEFAGWRRKLQERIMQDHTVEIGEYR